MTALADLPLRTISRDDLRGLFPEATWLWVLDTIRADTPVQFHEGDLAVDSFEAGDGPWILIVHGDLTATGDLDFSTSDYKSSLLVVCGSLRARNFRFTNGANCVVMHDLSASGYVFGRYGDESASLAVEGALTARAVLLDHVTGVDAQTLDAVVCSSEGWGLPIDIEYSAESHRGVFADETLDEDGCFDPYLGWQRARAGQPVLLDDAHARLRAERPELWRR